MTPRFGINHSRARPPGRQISFAPLDTLIPSAINPRPHDEANVARIAASIAEWGFTNPVLADAQGVVAGHGRVLAVRQLYGAGHTIRLPGGTAIPGGTIPVIDGTGWSDAQRRACLIADNRLAELSGWDESPLKLELEALRADGYEVELTGFEPGDLDALAFAPREPCAPDEFGLRDESIGTSYRCPKCSYLRLHRPAPLRPSA
ncbi:ParB/Srx family N-terminal domain-containing protein [Paraburkholderia heleia]|uniref:ParB/Srx family N-terminal domain-containing protein n=1 Tax=Paraburkholderia heleia TaxID=634127 RepID=UPI002AB63A83|nr:ParB/Srx family N-terminal domain-containing protein [Paraburkholderia heleia]